MSWLALAGCVFALAPVCATPLERPVPRLRVTSVQTVAGIEGAAAAAGSDGGRLQFTVEPNAIITARITLANIGFSGSSLAWEISSSSSACTAPTPASWLGVEPAFGRLDAGATIEAAVYASSFAAAGRSREGFLCIRSNDPVDAVVALPVTLIVDEAQALHMPALQTPGGPTAIHAGD